LEVVEDEQEQAPEVTAEFYPAPMNGSAPAEGGEVGSATDTTSAANAPKPPGKPPSPENGSALVGANGPAKPPVNGSGSLSAPNNGNGSSGFNQLRNEFLRAARRVATTKRQAVGEVVEWASGGCFKYGDIGRMTEADTPKLRAATELMASTLAGAPR